MANKSVVFKDGIITLKPFTGTPSDLVKGLIWVDNADGLPIVYNGSSSLKLVTVSSTQTLTNKTLTSPHITSPTGLVKDDVGLGNVDNTSDLNKPVSNATQAELDLKQDLAAALTEISDLTPSNDDVLQVKSGVWTNRTPAQLKTDLALVKADVGLGNVDNTSDATKNSAVATLTNKTIVEPLIDNFMDLNEESSPSAPAAGKLRVYPKTDSKLYYKDSTGTEYQIEASSDEEIELVYRKGSDYSGQTDMLIPQFPWSSPSRKSNPADLPTGQGNDVAISPNGEFAAVAHASSPYITIYQKQGITWVKLTNPGTLPGNTCNCIAWSPNGEFLAIGYSTTTPYARIYQRVGAVFTSVSIGTAITGGVNDIAWSSNGEYVAFAHATSPYITIKRRTAGTTFTNLSNPATLPTSTGQAIQFLPNRNTVVFTQTSTGVAPEVRVYDFSSTAIGTQVANNSGTVVVGTKAKISVSSGGERLAFSGGDGLWIFTLVGNTLTLETTLALAATKSCKYSINGKYLAVTTDGSINDYVIIYEIDGTTYTPLTILPSLTATPHNGIDISLTNEWVIVAHTATPYVSFYQTDEDMPEEGIGRVIGQPRDGQVW
jgi:WD40 repeat protein